MKRFLQAVIQIVGRDRQQRAVHLLAYRAHLSFASPPCQGNPIGCRVCASRMKHPLKYGELAEFGLSRVVSEGERLDGN
jgi:hypothetical protein